MSEWGRLQDALHDEFDRQGVTGVDVDKVIEHIVNLRDFFPGLLGSAPRAEGPQDDRAGRLAAALEHLLLALEQYGSGRGAAFQLEAAVDEARALVREETPE